MSGGVSECLLACLLGCSLGRGGVIYMNGGMPPASTSPMFFMVGSFRGTLQVCSPAANLPPYLSAVTPPGHRPQYQPIG